jgi:hypothetical protein
MQPAQLARLDAWRTAEGDGLTRPEAMRALIERGLSGRGAAQLDKLTADDPVEAGAAFAPAVFDPGEGSWADGDSFIIAPDVRAVRAILAPPPPRPAKAAPAPDLLGPLGPLRGRRRD